MNKMWLRDYIMPGILRPPRCAPRAAPHMQAHAFMREGRGPSERRGKARAQHALTSLTGQATAGQV